MTRTTGKITDLTPDLAPDPTTTAPTRATAHATMVRVYFSEADRDLRPLLRCLHDELKVPGATVIRGIAGFGASGVVHGSGLVDLSLDLPLILEFFDRPDRARAAIERIKAFVEPGHVVSWAIEVEVNGDAGR